ncbi:MAG TPA: SelB C-terminal domain-containing protein, partial [Bryobacteraceae bacterium]|nr:SelB C-terminal domain-containing protein [Bryobacteraceae bacterium]
AFRDRGLAVPSLQEVIASCGVDPVRGRSLLQILLRDRRLVKIGDDLVYHHTALETLRQLLAARKGERFAVPVFKEWTGVSRKYAIPLLEYLDRERVTRRDGDTRIVL